MPNAINDFRFGRGECGRAFCQTTIAEQNTDKIRIERQATLTELDWTHHRYVVLRVSGGVAQVLHKVAQR